MFFLVGLRPPDLQPRENSSSVIVILLLWILTSGRDRERDAPLSCSLANPGPAASRVIDYTRRRCHVSLRQSQETPPGETPPGVRRDEPPRSPRLASCLRRSFGHVCVGSGDGNNRRDGWGTDEIRIQIPGWYIRRRSLWVSGTFLSDLKPLI